MSVQANTWYWVISDQFSQTRERFAGPSGSLAPNQWYTEQTQQSDGSIRDWDPLRLVSGQVARIDQPFDVMIQDGGGRHTRLAMRIP
jgi:hypothetical protein